MGACVCAPTTIFNISGRCLRVRVCAAINVGNVSNCQI